MGYDLKATLVLGVELAKVYQVKEELRQVTKYDPDTGQAIVKEAKVVTGCTFLGVDYPLVIDPESQLYELGENVLSLHSPRDGSSNRAILGVAVSADPTNCVKPICPDSLRDSFVNAITKYPISKAQGLEPKFYLMFKAIY
jgi:hypothetical protein